MALRHGLQWLRDLSIHGVIVEMDCMQVVKAINSLSNITWNRFLMSASNFNNHLPVWESHTLEEKETTQPIAGQIGGNKHTRSYLDEEFPTCISHIIEAEKPV